MKILIVDDEEVSLTSVKRILKWHGLKNIEICDSGSEAIRKIRQENFDVVLLDLLMPEVDGRYWNRQNPTVPGRNLLS